MTLKVVEATQHAHYALLRQSMKKGSPMTPLVTTHVTTHLARIPTIRVALVLVTAAFAVLTAVALWQHGYWGIIEPHFQTSGAGQVFADLVIALSLFWLCMWREAKRSGRALWFWLVFTLVLGSFGPLLYLLTAPASAQSTE
jgi:hypothetical protein